MGKIKQKKKRTKKKYAIRKSKAHKSSCPTCGKQMFEFTKQEFEALKEQLMLNEELSLILEMKIKGYSITKMALEMNMSESTINRRIKQLKKKIMRVL